MFRWAGFSRRCVAACVIGRAFHRCGKKGRATGLSFRDFSLGWEGFYVHQKYFQKIQEAVRVTQICEGPAWGSYTLSLSAKQPTRMTWVKCGGG